ncbi:MAG: hypothetical protein CVU28_03375 [Betaproteobacteria bacterium HGW-Betaproteobacteria-21]|nr:MAG: hypothetical protein CVU28_03375 [Betaproteobacteria bacterium HGW-Betaproteobacteria-21]
MASDILVKTMNDAGEHPIDSWSEYRTAVLETIARAGSTLRIFDPDLSQTGLESIAGVDHLGALLQRSVQAEAIRILVRDPAFLERDCPRLMALLTRFGHRIAIRIASESLAMPESAFLIADGAHLVIRFHHERPRGKRCIEDGHAASERDAQFETLWESARTGPSGAPIGL